MSLVKKVLTISAAAGVIAFAAAPAAASPTPPPGFHITAFATAPATLPATTSPDDIAVMGKNVFVGWQNGVGSMGEPNPTAHQTYSRLVQYSTTGTQLHTWLLTGKLEGLGANTKTGQIVATANEDGNSHLFTISPTTYQVTPYVYQPDPASVSTGGVFTGGGTDGVTVINGKIFLGASNPQAANATATFQVSLDPSTGVASLSPTFADNATARDAVTGQKVTLALTDPDSNALVPPASNRFASQYMIDGQGDQQLVFAKNMGTSSQRLTRLLLTHSGMSAGVDDVRWTAGDNGTLLIVDNGANTIYAVKGPFKPSQAYASLDNVGCGGTPANTEVDSLNLHTGALTPFVTGLTKAKGLVWLP